MYVFREIGKKDKREILVEKDYGCSLVIILNFIIALMSYQIPVQ